MFLELILSNADVVQRILEFVVASRLPSVVHEDLVLDVNRAVNHAVVRLASLPFPKCFADVQELGLLPERIAIPIPLS